MSLKELLLIAGVALSVAIITTIIIAYFAVKYKNSKYTADRAHNSEILDLEDIVDSDELKLTNL